MNQFEELSKIVSIIFRSSNESVFDKENILVAVYELLRHTNENNIDFYQKQNWSDDGYLSDDTLIVDEEHLSDLKKEQEDHFQSSFEKNKDVQSS